MATEVDFKTRLREAASVVDETAGVGQRVLEHETAALASAKGW